jgi:hypothetical protein
MKTANLKPFVTIRKAFRRWLLRSLQPCQTIVPLMSESMDRSLGPGEWWQLRLHLIVCAWCSRYLKQIRFIRTAHKIPVRNSNHRRLPSRTGNVAHGPKQSKQHQRIRYPAPTNEHAGVFFSDRLTRKFDSMVHTNARCVEETLARISDGSSRAGPVYVLGMCIHRPAVSPVIAGCPNNSGWCVAAVADGNGDGLNCNSDHLFASGPEIGSTL